MHRWKVEQGRVREKRKIRRKKIKKKEDIDARKGREIVKYFVFLIICGFGGSKNRLVKATGIETGAETAGQILISKLKF